MKIIVILILLISSWACTRYEKTTVEDRFQKIQAMIDQKRYPEAEQELSLILATEPGNERARVIYASLFVHKAGITVKEYFVLEKLTHMESEEERAKRPGLIDLAHIEKLEIKPNTDLGKAFEFVADLNGAAKRAHEVVEKFNRIPKLSDENAENIYLALKELEKIEQPNTGNSLYRGVIKVLYFKYLWDQERFFQIGNGKLCSLPLEKLDQKLGVFAQFTSGMIRDLAFGFPKSKEQFNLAADDLKKHTRAAQSWLGLAKLSKKNLSQVIESLARTQSISGVSCDF